jgi:hypothetical protein
MPQTIYASFTDIEQAEKAAGALLDYGVLKEDLSLVGNTNRPQSQEEEVGTAIPIYPGNPAMTGLSYGVSPIPTTAIMAYGEGFTNDDRLASGNAYEDEQTAEYDEMLRSPHDGDDDRYAGTNRLFDENIDNEYSDAMVKSGITTTTAEDAGAGAVKGTGIGLGLGVLAGIASLFIPGVGLVVGGGALAAAIGAAALTTGAGAVAGGVVGYLKDQGIGEVEAARYQQNIGAGGALVAVNLPSNGVDLQAAELVLHKYGATEITSY